MIASLRVTFTKDFDWSPPERNGRVHIAYKAGMTMTVRRKCAEDAIAAGAAILETKGDDDHGTR